jgi:DNA-binding GntR family transcriptional regulator
MNVSRTPVIEALKRLESEGLVEIIPQVGCRVIRPSSTTVAELFALRGALEGLAAEVAAARITQDELDELAHLQERMESAAARADESKFDEFDYEFHVQIIAASGMPRLKHNALGVWSLLRYQLARLPSVAEDMPQSLDEHAAIYDALRRGAGKRARSAAERHVSRAGDALAAYLAKKPDNADGSPREPVGPRGASGGRRRRMSTTAA